MVYYKRTIDNKYTLKITFDINDDAFVISLNPPKSLEKNRGIMDQLRANCFKYTDDYIIFPNY